MTKPVDARIGRSVAELRAEAVHFVRELIAGGGFSHEMRTDFTREHLLLVAEDQGAGAFLRLDAALALALVDEPRALPVLRLVFIRPGFAATNSVNEVAYAALGLALLGDTASIPLLRRAMGMPINLGATAIPLALKLLDPPRKPAR